MARIRRRAVRADRRPRANGRAVVRVERVVALGAEAAELAQAERIVVAMMVQNMIGDACSRDATDLKADTAQRLDHELMTTPPLPYSA